MVSILEKMKGSKIKLAIAGLFTLALIFMLITIVTIFMCPLESPKDSKEFKELLSNISTIGNNHIENKLNGTIITDLDVFKNVDNQKFVSEAKQIIENNFSVTVDSVEDYTIPGKILSKGYVINVSVTGTDFDEYSDNILSQLNDVIVSIIKQNVDSINSNIDTEKESEDIRKILIDSMKNLSTTSKQFKVYMMYNMYTRDWVIADKSENENSEELHKTDGLSDDIKDLIKDTVMCGFSEEELRLAFGINKVTLENILTDEQYKELLNETINRLLDTKEHIDYRGYMW